MAKYIMSVRGDTDNPNFTALQQLVLESGFSFSMRPDEQKSVASIPITAPTKKLKRILLPDGRRSFEYLLDVMRQRHDRRLALSDASRLLMQLGQAKNTASGALSILVKEGKVRRVQDGLYELVA